MRNAEEQLDPAIKSMRNFNNMVKGLLIDQAVAGSFASLKGEAVVPLQLAIEPPAHTANPRQVAVLSSVAGR